MKYAGKEIVFATRAWQGRAELGLTINEFYGQTECNLVISACSALDVVRAGSIGFPVPGHDVAVIDEEGTVREIIASDALGIARPIGSYWESLAAI